MTEPTRVPAPPPSRRPAATHVATTAIEAAAPCGVPRRAATRRAALDRHDPRLDGWRAFLMSHSLVTRRLDDELRVEQGISLAEYDALVQLAAAPGSRLRMNQLAERVLLSRSGVTRLVDRLVADGLVTRATCPSDARGAMAVLSERGRSTLREASRTHLRGVELYFLSVLDDDDLRGLRRALDGVIERASAGTPLEGCTSSRRPEDRAVE